MALVAEALQDSVEFGWVRTFDTPPITISASTLVEETIGAGRDFESINSWNVAHQNNIDGFVYSGQLTDPFYQEDVVISGATGNDADSFRRLESFPTNDFVPYTGSGATVRRATGGTGFAIDLQEAYCELRYVGVEYSGTGNSTGVVGVGGNTKVYGVVAVSYNEGSFTGSYTFRCTSGTNASIDSCISVDGSLAGGNPGSFGGFLLRPSTTIRNCAGTNTGSSLGSRVFEADNNTGGSKIAYSSVAVESDIEWSEGGRDRAGEDNAYSQDVAWGASPYLLSDWRNAYRNVTGLDWRHLENGEVIDQGFWGQGRAPSFIRGVDHGRNQEIIGIGPYDPVPDILEFTVGQEGADYASLEEWDLATKDMDCAGTENRIIRAILIDKSYFSSKQIILGEGATGATDYGRYREVRPAPGNESDPITGEGTGYLFQTTAPGEVFHCFDLRQAHMRISYLAVLNDVNNGTSHESSCIQLSGAYTGAVGCYVQGIFTQPTNLGYGVNLVGNHSFAWSCIAQGAPGITAGQGIRVGFHTNGTNFFYLSHCVADAITGGTTQPRGFRFQSGNSQRLFLNNCVATRCYGYAFPTNGQSYSGTTPTLLGSNGNAMEPSFAEGEVGPFGQNFISTVDPLTDFEDIGIRNFKARDGGVLFKSGFPPSPVAYEGRGSWIPIKSFLQGVVHGDDDTLLDRSPYDQAEPALPPGELIQEFLNENFAVAEEDSSVIRRKIGAAHALETIQQWESATDYTFHESRVAEVGVLTDEEYLVTTPIVINSTFGVPTEEFFRSLEPAPGNEFDPVTGAGAHLSINAAATYAVQLAENRARWSYTGFTQTRDSGSCLQVLQGREYNVVVGCSFFGVAGQTNAFPMLEVASHLNVRIDSCQFVSINNLGPRLGLRLTDQSGSNSVVRNCVAHGIDEMSSDAAGFRVDGTNTTRFEGCIATDCETNWRMIGSFGTSQWNGSSTNDAPGANPQNNLNAQQEFVDPDKGDLRNSTSGTVTALQAVTTGVPTIVKGVFHGDADSQDRANLGVYDGVFASTVQETVSDDFGLLDQTKEEVGARALVEDEFDAEDEANLRQDAREVVADVFSKIGEMTLAEQELLAGDFAMADDIQVSETRRLTVADSFDLEDEAISRDAETEELNDGFSVTDEATPRPPDIWRSIQKNTIAVSRNDLTVAVPLLKGQDPAKCVPFVYSSLDTYARRENLAERSLYTWDTEFTGRDLVLRRRLSNVGGNSVEQTLEIFIVEFGNRARVQSGRVDIASTLSSSIMKPIDVDLPIQVDHFKAFAHVEYSTTGNTADHSFLTWSLGDLRLRLARRLDNLVINGTASWYVVESDDLSVQHLQTFLDPDQTTGQRRTPGTADLQRSFVLGSHTGGTSSRLEFPAGWATQQLISEDLVQLDRGNTGSRQYHSIQIVTDIGDVPVRVHRGRVGWTPSANDALTKPVAGFTYSQPASWVNLPDKSTANKRALSGYLTEDGAAELLVRPFVSTDTNLQFFRGTGPNGQAAQLFELIEFPVDVDRVQTIFAEDTLVFQETILGDRIRLEVTDTIGYAGWDPAPLTDPDQSLIESIQYETVRFETTDLQIDVPLTEGQDTTQVTPRYSLHSSDTSVLSSDGGDRSDRVNFMAEVLTGPDRVRLSRESTGTVAFLIHLEIIEWAGNGIVDVQTGGGAFNTLDAQPVLFSLNNFDASISAVWHTQKTSITNDNDDEENTLVQFEAGAVSSNVEVLTEAGAIQGVDKEVRWYAIQSFGLAVQHQNPGFVGANGSNSGPGELINQTIASVTQTETMLITSKTLGDAGNDPRVSDFRCALTSATNVQMSRRRGNNEALNLQLQVVSDVSNARWFVQRFAITLDETSSQSPAVGSPGQIDATFNTVPQITADRYWGNGINYHAISCSQGGPRNDFVRRMFGAIFRVPDTDQVRIAREDNNWALGNNALRPNQQFRGEVIEIATPLSSGLALETLADSFDVVDEVTAPTFDGLGLVKTIQPFSFVLEHGTANETTDSVQLNKMQDINQCVCFFSYYSELIGGGAAQGGSGHFQHLALRSFFETGPDELTVERQTSATVTPESQSTLHVEGYIVEFRADVTVEQIQVTWDDLQDGALPTTRNYAISPAATSLGTDSSGAEIWDTFVFCHWDSQHALTDTVGDDHTRWNFRCRLSSSTTVEVTREYRSDKDSVPSTQNHNITIYRVSSPDLRVVNIDIPFGADEGGEDTAQGAAGPLSWSLGTGTAIDRTFLMFGITGGGTRDNDRYAAFRVDQTSSTTIEAARLADTLWTGGSSTQTISGEVNIQLIEDVSAENQWLVQRGRIDLIEGTTGTPNRAVDTQTPAIPFDASSSFLTAGNYINTTANSVNDIGTARTFARIRIDGADIEARRSHDTSDFQNVNEPDTPPNISTGWQLITVPMAAPITVIVEQLDDTFVGADTLDEDRISKEAVPDTLVAADAVAEKGLAPITLPDVIDLADDTAVETGKKVTLGDTFVMADDATGEATVDLLLPDTIDLPDQVDLAIPLPPGAGLFISQEKISFRLSDGDLSTARVQLTKGQDWTQCLVFFSMYYEIIDDTGGNYAVRDMLTPYYTLNASGLQFNRFTETAPGGAITEVIIEAVVAELNPDVTVEQQFTDSILAQAGDFSASTKTLPTPAPASEIAINSSIIAKSDAGSTWRVISSEVYWPMRLLETTQSYWNLNETTGDRADDFASNDLVEFNGGVGAVQPGLNNGAAAFNDNTNSILEIRHPDQVGLDADTFGASVWVQWLSFAADRTVFATTSDRTEGWEVQILTDGSVRFRGWSGGNQQWSITSAANTILLGLDWNHIAISRNNNSGPATLWVDGVVVASVAASGNTDWNANMGPNDGFALGGRPSIAETFDGWLDEASFHFLPLGQNEVDALYQSGDGSFFNNTWFRRYDHESEISSYDIRVSAGQNQVTGTWLYSWQTFSTTDIHVEKNQFSVNNAGNLSLPHGGVDPATSFYLGTYRSDGGTSPAGAAMKQDLDNTFSNYDWAGSSDDTQLATIIVQDLRNPADRIFVQHGEITLGAGTLGSHPDVDYYELPEEVNPEFSFVIHGVNNANATNDGTNVRQGLRAFATLCLTDAFGGPGGTHVEVRRSPDQTDFQHGNPGAETTHSFQVISFPQFGVIKEPVDDDFSITDDVIERRVLKVTVADAFDLADEDNVETRLFETVADLFEVTEAIDTVSSATVSETIDLEETLDFEAIKRRTVADSLDFTDALQTLETAELADSFVLIDFADTESSADIVDSAQFTDAVAAETLQLVEENDTASFTDELRVLITTTEGDTFDITDAAVELEVARKTLPDSFDIDGEPGAQALVEDQLDATFTFTDFIDEDKGAEETIGDAFDLADAIDEDKGAEELLAETIGLADDEVSEATAFDTVPDTFDLTEQFQTVDMATLADFFNLLDQAQSESAKEETVADAFDLADEDNVAPMAVETVPDEFNVKEAQITVDKSSLADQFNIFDFADTEQTGELVSPTVWTDAIVHEAVQPRTFADTADFSDAIQLVIKTSENDQLDVTDDVADVAAGRPLVEDQLDLVGDPVVGAANMEQLDETIGLTDFAQPKEGGEEVLAETLALAEDLDTRSENIFPDAAIFTDVLTTFVREIETLADSFQVVGEPDKESQTDVEDSATFTDAETSPATARETLGETFGLTDALQTLGTATLADQFNLADPLETESQADIPDFFAFTDALQTRGTSTVPDQLDLTDAITTGELVDLEESAAFSDEIALRIITGDGQLADQFSIVDAVDPDTVLQQTLADQLDLTDFAQAAYFLRDDADWNDEATTRVDAVETLSETLGLADEAATRVDATEAVPDQLNLLDLLETADTSFQFDQLSLEDALQTRETATLADAFDIDDRTNEPFFLDDSFAVQDALETQSTNVFPAELDLTDEPTARTTVQLTVGDTFGLVDQFTSSDQQTLAETVTFDEDITQVGLAIKPLDEALDVLDDPQLQLVSGVTVDDSPEFTDTVEAEQGLAPLQDTIVFEDEVQALLRLIFVPGVNNVWTVPDCGGNWTVPEEDSTWTVP